MSAILNKKYMMIVVLCCIFFSGMGISSCAPIFPNEATARGVSQFVTGIIFSAHPICMFLVASILGTHMPNNRILLIIIGISI